MPRTLLPRDVADAAYVAMLPVDFNPSVSKEYNCTWRKGPAAGKKILLVTAGAQYVGESTEWLPHAPIAYEPVETRLDRFEKLRASITLIKPNDLIEADQVKSMWLEDHTPAFCFWYDNLLANRMQVAAWALGKPVEEIERYLADSKT